LFGEKNSLTKKELKPFLIDEKERKKHRVSFNEKGEIAAKIELKEDIVFILLLRILKFNFASKKELHLICSIDFDLSFAASEFRVHNKSK